MSKKWWYYGRWDEDDDDDDLFSTSSGASSGDSPYYSSGGYSYYGRKYTSSLGWSRNKLSDSSSYYSSWGGGSSWSYSGSGDSFDKSGLLLLAKAYKAVRDMVVILDFPFEVIVRLSKYSNGLKAKTKKTRTIFVPSKVIDSSNYTDDEKINILCGLGTHEASHLKYTEYRTYTNFTKDAKREEKFFTNLIEDVRVEDRLLSERPGYLNFIEQANKFRYSELEKAVLSTSTPSEVNNILLNVIKFIRYPDKVDTSVIRKYEAYFKEINNILSEDRQFTKDSCIIGSKLYSRLCDIFTELKYDARYIQLFIDDICPDNSFELKYGQDAGGGSLEDSELADLFKSSTSASILYDEVITGMAEIGNEEKTYIKKPTGDSYKYQEIKKQILKYIPGIKKLIQGTDKNYDFIVHGCREGLLDTNKLAEAYQGVPQVYIKKGKVQTNKTTVCVLIDQSGSMYGGKMSLARQAAVLLNESLKDLPGVDLYIYGHSADEVIRGDTCIYSYREGSKYKPAYALSDATAHRNNRDGTAILEVAKRIRKQTQDNCIMFVLSDGQPCAHNYGGWSSVQDVRSKVKQVEKMGFTVIQISIDYVHYAKEMFDNVISLEYEISNLPKRLSQIIKKAIVRSKTTTVS